MAFQKGVSPNPAGRPKVKDVDKLSNKAQRNRYLLELLRKFKPLQTKAIKAAVDVLDNKDSSEGGKLKSAALIIQTYKDLIKETYDYKYDDDINEEIQVENVPKFSLHMIKE